MKQLVHLVVLIAASLMVFNACKIEKRLHRPGYHVEWKKSQPSKSRSQEVASNTESDKNARKEINQKESEVASPELSAHDNTDENDGRWRPANELAYRLASDYQYNQQNAPDLFFQDECETLVMVDGRRLAVKVIEINQQEIKYKKCDYLQGPTITVDKKDVDRIIYANGAEDIISGYSAPESRSPRSSSESDGQPVQKRLEIMALMSMLFGITGLFIAAIVFGLMAIIFAMISFMKFSANPKEFGGRGMAIAGIIIGILDVVLFLAFIAATA